MSVTGDGVPSISQPTLVRLWEAGRFPIERIMRVHDFDRIDEAVTDAEAGTTVEPELRMT